MPFIPIIIIILVVVLILVLATNLKVVQQFSTSRSPTLSSTPTGWSGPCPPLRT